MRRYNGTLIYETHDDDGIIEIVEANGVRSLHFGSYPKQSSMALEAPDTLLLSYSRAMMSWRLFLDGFDDALLVGLGGGSLAKYLLKHFPHGNIDVYETREQVVKVARSHFRVPDDPRLSIHVGDGGDYIRQTACHGEKHYDLIMLDAYDHNAMSASVNGPLFFDACRDLLRPQGVMAINLWGVENPYFEETVDDIGQSFDQKILQVPVHNRDNVIVLGFSSAFPKLSFQQLRDKAELMEQQSQIEYGSYLKMFKKYNAATLKRVMQ